MEFYSWILQNRETIKIIYALLIVLICAIISLKSHKMFKLSDYQGIRYLRNAFFFYGIAFFIRYILGSNFYSFPENYINLINGLFGFFFIMGGFFLLYSLLWKKIESIHNISFSSIFNFRIFIFYLMAIIFVLLDYFWNSFHFLFYSQAIIFLMAFAISFNNYYSNGRNRKFLKFYTFAMLLAFIAWTLNAVIEKVFHWDPRVHILIYLLNIIVFLVFLFGIIKVTQRK